MDYIDLDVRCPRKANLIGTSLTIYPVQPLTTIAANTKNSYIYWINSHKLIWCYSILSLIPHV